MARPTQEEMDMNMMSGGKKNYNANALDTLVEKSRTGNSKTNSKAGGKKTIDINKKMKKIMRKKGMIK